MCVKTWKASETKFKQTVTSQGYASLAIYQLAAGKI
jgi:hypothetical protein